MNTYDKAVQLLNIRPHYSVELAQKLLLRGFDKLDVEKVINRLTQEGLLNDVQYAQMYMEELIRNKTFGFYGLKAKLMQRGIPATVAEILLKENLTLEVETEIAQKVAEHEARSLKQVDKIKLMQKLSRKGFRSEVIRQITNNHSGLKRVQDDT